jgi:leader peptidase (prepilin peptidase) / N-methyltransferase
MGLGDVKLAPALGATLGYFSWNDVFLGTAAAFGFGALYAIPRVMLRRSTGRDTIPFGPFIIAGAFAVLLTSAQ